ncbi:MAG: bis-aminopropyl spermidine synthase family protein, partial [Candidatus Hermodarchaeota archaeon]
MINEDKRLLDLYNLLISGDYLSYDTVSFLNFLKILKLIRTSNKFSTCVKKSHISLSSFLGIIKFLQNVSIIKLHKTKRIQILNDEIFDSLYKIPSQISIFWKLTRKIPQKYYILRNPRYLTKISLLKLYRPRYKLSIRNFQLPCSIRTSIKRMKLIASNLQFKSQKALFIGDDDLVSILCKFIIPELSITVIEIDGRITKLLKEIVNKNKFQDFKVFNLDFKVIKQSSEFFNQKYSIVHLDPPYEENELQDFLNIIELIIDDKISQIYLNGLYDDNSQPIINSFVAKNNLNISRLIKSFNSYPFNYLDSKNLKLLKKEININT